MKKCYVTLNPKARKDALLSIDASATPGFSGDKEEAGRRVDDMRMELASLQEKLYAQRRHRVLIVLQAMDTGGKDGLIRHLFTGVNPMGVQVARFERPTGEELAHDYLWRVHARVPASGQIVVFNRSHYEDVLTVRVNGMVPEKVWRRRYAHIRHFESLLADEGTTILKFYLHIDNEEQRERLQARLDDPEKNWKFDAHDLEQRKLWNEYMVAFRDAIVETDRKEAPWFVIPSNRKWFRNYAVMSILLDRLRRLDIDYPAADPQLAQYSPVV